MLYLQYKQQRSGIKMEIRYVGVDEVRLNESNPRSIRGEQFRKLGDSLLVFPKMMELRPVVVDSAGVVLGGNMRLHALQSLSALTPDQLNARLGAVRDYKKLKKAEKAAVAAWWAEWLKAPKVPIVRADDLTEREQREFIVKDNASFGEWDWDALSGAFEMDELKDWGVDLAGFGGDDDNADDSTESEGDDAAPDDDGGDGADGEGEDGDDWNEDFERMMVEDCLYKSNNVWGIPTLLLDWQAKDRLLLPVAAWGADSRLRQDVYTYHFYVDDYRFNALWKNPDKLLRSGARAIVEPNLSTYDQMPLAYGLHLIYKKRWIARWLQDCGVRVYADLNVAVKFREYNLMGLPEGWNAFATRGYMGREELLREEIEIARRVSGLQSPNIFVYGGGATIQWVCAQENVLYLESVMRERALKRKAANG